MKVGYARASTYGQSLEAQVAELEAYGCEKIFKEKRSGKNSKRPELQNALDYVRDGQDELVVTKIDRMARSLRDLLNILEALKEKGVAFKALRETQNLGTATGKLTMQILGAVAEFERELINERVLEGLEHAKKKGVKLGAKPKLSDQQKADIRSAHHDGTSPTSLAAQYGVSRRTIYRIVERTG